MRSNRNVTILIPRELDKDSPICMICHLRMDTGNHVTCYKTHKSAVETDSCKYFSLVTAERFIHNSWKSTNSPKCNVNNEPVAFAIDYHI